LIGCSHQKDYKELIQGDWRSDIIYNIEYFDRFSGKHDSLLRTSSLSYQYSEVFFSDDYCYELSYLFMAFHRKYTIQKDSIYFYHDSKEETGLSRKGKIVFLDAQKLMIAYDQDSITYHRIPSYEESFGKFVIEDSIKGYDRFKKSIDSFSKSYQKRFYQQMDQYQHE
jgi:hypothetical protein